MDPVERAKIALGVKTDSALSRALGVAQSVIGGYNRRHSVPLEQCIKIAEMTGVDLNWLILGTGIAPDGTSTAKPDIDPMSQLSIQEQMLLTGFRALKSNKQTKAFEAIIALANDDENHQQKPTRQFNGDIAQYNEGDGHVENQVFNKNK